MLKLIVSKTEAALLKGMRSLGYGEMYSVEIPDGLYEVSEMLSAAETDLIDFIRDGHPHIDILHVHQGEPTSAEIDFVHCGFRCRKKAKFPVP
jgi:hypothetical protein